MKEKGHLIKVLKQTKKALIKKDVVVLKDLSNMTIHSASVQQTDIYVLMAVMIYSLSKIYERSRYKRFKTWNLFNRNCLILPQI